MNAVVLSINRVKEQTPPVRTYRSSLRERQVQQTRELILRALAEEILAGGLHDLSVAAVAARAEVAERTIYRHFPNVSALLDGLRAFVGEQLAAHMDGPLPLREDTPAPIEEIVARIPALYRALDAVGAPARAAALVTLQQGDDPGRSERAEALRRALQPELTHLDEASARAVIDTIRSLAGSLSWFLLTRDGRTSGAQAGEAAARILLAMLTGFRAERRRADDLD
jgi:AcrR family transcriptional regulator